MMRGYRTLVTNVVALLVTFAALQGIDVPAADADAIVGGVVAVITVVNIVLRFMTTTPVGKK